MTAFLANLIAAYRAWRKRRACTHQQVYQDARGMAICCACGRDCGPIDLFNDRHIVDKRDATDAAHNASASARVGHKFYSGGSDT